MFHFIKRFSHGIWITLRFIRECILNIIVFSLLLIFISAFLISKNIQNNTTNKPTDTTSQNLLLLNISGSIVEQTSGYNSLLLLKQNLSPSLSLNAENSLYDIVEIIQAATDDPQIKGMVLKLDELNPTSLTSLQYIGKYLNAFKQAGKKLYAIGQDYSSTRYYLASFADKIYLQPQGAVNLYGLSAYTLYYKELLDKLDVDAQVFRVGTYKSAVEPMLLNEMSPEAKENLSRWLNGMWQSYLNDVAKNRQMPPEELVPAADILLARLKQSSNTVTQYELDNHLVDQVVTYTQFWQLMKKEFGSEAMSSDDELLDMYTYYSKLQTQNKVTPATSNENEIAVIVANGSIVNQTGSEADIDLKVLIDQIREARRNPNVKAVVFRVNSPGGSVTASEQIRNELQALRSAGKKIVVSMGSMAASGGYWISSVSDTIIASPNTLTGSIGVFGLMPNVEKALAKFGVHTDGVATSPLAATGMTKTLTTEQSTAMQLSVETVYRDFLSIVANARNKTVEQVDSIAQGRVWIGSDALNIGLVDKLGDFDDAVDAAAKLANLEQYEVNWLEPEQTFLERLLNYLSKYSSNAVQSLLPRSLITLNNQIKQEPFLLNQLDDPRNSYIYCLNCANVQ